MTLVASITLRPATIMQPPAIRLSSVTKDYETRDGALIKAVSSVSLDVHKDEFLAVVGPSGCGKSTILQMLAGLLAPTSGTIEIGGEVVRGPRRDLGIVFQQALLLPWYNVLENVLMPIRVQRRNVREYRDRARELLELVGLSEFASRLPRELSGGMSQRVSIARALIHDPDILLMDEPFGALDAMTRESMNLELQRIWQERKKTVVFITHSISEAVFLADRVVVMSSRPGRITGCEEVPIERPRSELTYDDSKFTNVTALVRSSLEGSPSDANSGGSGRFGGRHE